MDSIYLYQNTQKSEISDLNSNEYPNVYSYQNFLFVPTEKWAAEQLWVRISHYILMEDTTIGNLYFGLQQT